MVSIEALSVTLRSIAVPGMTPKALRAAVRDKHPKASKKDIVRAAFYALTGEPLAVGNGLAELHGFALVERVSEDEPAVAAGTRHKGKRHRAKAKAAVVATSEPAVGVN